MENKINDAGRTAGVNTKGEEININMLSTDMLLDQIHARCTVLIFKIEEARHLDDGQVELNRLAEIARHVQMTMTALAGRKIDRNTAEILHEKLSTIHSK